MAPVKVNIREIRERLNWSRQKLADLAGVHARTIMRLESGQSKPQKKKYNRVMRALRKGQRAIQSIQDKTQVSSKSRPGMSDKGISERESQPGLSDVDLQIINRILNMSDREKIELLMKLNG